MIVREQLPRDISGATGQAVPPSGLGRELLQRAVSLLPRGRARIARGLSRMLRTEYVARVPPVRLGIDLVIDPSDPFQLEICFGTYQPHVVSFLLHTVRPGDVVLCAGLHVGYVAAVARRLSGPSGLVLTAEPDPMALRTARRNLALGTPERDARVEILEAGLSDADSETEFYQSAVLGHSSFASPHHVGAVTKALLRRGDGWLRDLGVERLDVMVLDVEGWEIHALRGLEDTLGRSPGVKALVEVSSWALKDAGSSPAELVEFLKAHGFELRWAARHGGGIPYGVSGMSVESGMEALATDILCLGPAALPR